MQGGKTHVSACLTFWESHLSLRKGNPCNGIYFDLRQDMGMEERWGGKCKFVETTGEVWEGLPVSSLLAILREAGKRFSPPT